MPIPLSQRPVFVVFTPSKAMVHALTGAVMRQAGWVATAMLNDEADAIAVAGATGNVLETFPSHGRAIRNSGRIYSPEELDLFMGRDLLMAAE